MAVLAGVMTIIHATGAAETRHLAERATVRARTSISSADRADSIARATKLHNGIVTRARQLCDEGGAVSFEADPISTWAHRVRDDSTGPAGVIEHTTTSEIRILLQDLDLVSPLISELAAAGAETNVEWSLTDDSRRAHEQAVRKTAVVAARAVADDYAAALGERVIRVESISDSGMHGPGLRMVAMQSASAHAEVTLPEITVSATVQGSFETGPGSSAE